MSPTSLHNTNSWAALSQSLTFCTQQFETWLRVHHLDSAGCGRIQQQLEEEKRLAEDFLQMGTEFPTTTGFIEVRQSEEEAIQDLRNSDFLLSKIREFQRAGHICSNETELLQSEVNTQLEATTLRLERKGIDVDELRKTVIVEADSLETATKDSGEPPKVALDTPEAIAPTTEDLIRKAPHRNLLELVLDPKSIQWLMNLGGGLMVIGLIILLWVNHFFTPPKTAVALGLANLGLFASGCWLLQLTRFQLAGRALTLLSCLVMPLNLWYYSANNLITIDGHLWVAAVAISCIYAFSAWLLKDEAFVYVFCGGITLAGLMMIADIPPSPSKFWEIRLPSTMLIIMGVLSIHAERIFSPGSGPFSRKRFGLAFFQSGHALLASGLLLILGAQIAGDWLYEICFEPIYLSRGLKPSPICGELRWLAISLVGLATYTYAYSDLVVRRWGGLMQVAAFTLLWLEVLLIQALNLQVGIDAMIAVLAATSLLMHLLEIFAGQQAATKAFPGLGLLFGLLPVLIGAATIATHLTPSTLAYERVLGEHQITWFFAGAMLLTAIVSRTGVYVNKDSGTKSVLIYFLAFGTSLLTAASSALLVVGVTNWEYQAPILMLFPVGYLLIPSAYSSKANATSARRVAHFVTAIIMTPTLALSATSLFANPVDVSACFGLGLACALGAVFYMTGAIQRRRSELVFASASLINLCVLHLLAFIAGGTQTYFVVFALVGLLQLIGYRLLRSGEEDGKLARAVLASSNCSLSLTCISAVFYSLFAVLAKFEPSSNMEVSLNWSFVGFGFCMVTVVLLASAITWKQAIGKGYLVAAMAQIGLTLLTMHQVVELRPWQQVELFALLAGGILLAVGHWGWYRERDKQDETVSLSLMSGAWLSSVPLAIATWVDRYQGQFYFINEFGFLFVSITLLATGLVFQLKSSTIVGSLMTGLYFLTLLLFVPWSQLNSVALAITLGGGTIFGLGLILAFFRERLLDLPEQVKKRQGVFRVLTWR